MTRSNFLVVFFLLSLLFFEYMPQCVKDCDRKFGNENALSRHHKTCPILEVVRQKSQEIRKDRGIRGAPLAKVLTLLSRKGRLQVSDLWFVYHNFYVIVFRYCRHILRAQQLQGPWPLLLWR